MHVRGVEVLVAIVLGDALGIVRVVGMRDGTTSP
jgi:hypothetical protein